MSIIQISKIQQRSGNLVDLPQLNEAEFGFATDAKKLYIGKESPNENIEVLTSYSSIAFSQIDGAVGNLNITAGNLANGEILAYDGNNWVNKGGPAGGLLTLGNVSNVQINGGQNGYVLATDGTGNLSWEPKTVYVAYISDITQANPAVVTTTEENFFTEGCQVTITEVEGMTQINGNNFYYANIINSFSFAVFTDSTLTVPLNSTGFSPYTGNGRVITTVGGSGGATAAGGANTQIQFNQNSILAGDSDFTWNYSTNILTVNGNAALNGGSITTIASTYNLLNANATTVNFAGAGTDIQIGAGSGNTNINHNLIVDLDAAINGGDLTTTQSTFNLINANATTVNFAGAGTDIQIGAGSGNTNINHNLIVDLDAAINGGDLTTTQSTFNLINANATTVNFAGAGTDVQIGSASGNTNINHNLIVDLDAAINGGDLTTTQSTFNLINANATTVNFAGAGTDVQIGAGSGNTNINHNLIVDLDAAINGGDLTTTQSTFNLVNANATTVYFAGVGTDIQIGAGSGNTNINHNLIVDLDVAINGGDLTTTQSTFNLINANATTVYFAGAGTDIQIGSASGNTNINNNLIVDGNLDITGNVHYDGNLDVNGNINLDGNFLTTTQSTFNLINANATTVNFAGAGTDIQIGAASGNTNINNNLIVDLDANIIGNLKSLNANLGNLATANYVNVANQINGNIANFSGNLTALNANLGNLAQANYVNVANQINGNIANFSGNLTALNANLGNLVEANYVNVASNIITNNLAVNLQLSGNTANFTGNIVTLNANLGNLAQANYVNVANQINGNIANFSGNLTSLNANLGNLATANYVNVSSNIVTNNLTVNLELSGNTANFSGNIVTLNANLGNLASANYVNVANQINGNIANFSGNLTSLNANLGNLAQANYLNVASNIVTNNLTVNLELSGNTANFTGNIVALNANLGNLATANYVNVANQINGNIANFSGNLTSLNANLGNLAQANYVNVANQINGNIANFSGNLTALNANLGNLATANYINVSSNIVTNNLSVNLEISGNTANFTGNITALNANLGNLAQANYVNVANQINGNIANFSGNLTALNANLGNLATANYVNVANQINGNIANFSGNLTAANANLGNLATANYVNVANQINGNIANFSGNLTALNANLGNLANANYFSGDGSYLTNVNGGNVSNVANANNSSYLGGVAAANYLLVTGTGGSLTAVNGANVTGTVASANNSSYLGGVAAANYLLVTGTGGSLTAVNGANVTGQVGNASVASTVYTNAQPNITSTGTLTGLTVSGNINGTGATVLTTTVTGTNSANLLFANMADNDQFRILVGGTATNAGYVEIATADDGTEPIYVRQYTGVFTSLVRTATILDGSGNTSFPGSVTASGFVQTTSLTTGANSTAGSITGNWTLTSGSKLEATYADLAEYYEADHPYEPGTVLEFGGDKEVTLATDGTTRVAGVVSTNPAYVMNSYCDGENVVALALQGRVPCKVRGNIVKGDMMISGGNGYARPAHNPIIGSVIGKALQNFNGEGVIEVAVGRL